MIHLEILDTTFYVVYQNSSRRDSAEYNILGPRFILIVFTESVNYFLFNWT